MFLPVRKLYILIRTDMASMTTGRIAAQASHASNQFVFQYYKDLERLTSDPKTFEDLIYRTKRTYSEWESQTSSGFGTVIVLNGGTEADIRSTLDKLDENDYTYAKVVDPEYPIKDGNSIHFVENVLTCAYVFPIHDRADNHELSHLKLL